MKKLIITIFTLALVICLGATLAACNNATPQGQLEDPLGFDHKSETFVYDALDTFSGDTGTYTVKLQGYDAGQDVTDFEGAELKGVEKGILVTGELTFNDDISRTGCYFKLVGSSTTYMVPVASYTVHITNDVETFRLSATYDSKYYNYERTVNGTKDSGRIKISGTYFDNNEFHQMLRTVSTYSSGLSLAYVMPLVTETEALAVNITATTSTVTSVTCPYTNSITRPDSQPAFPDGIECYEVKINRSTDVAGISQTLYYATVNIPTDVNYPNIRVLKNILVKIIEPYKVDGRSTFSATEDDKQVEKPIQMEYTLRTATIG